MNKINTNKHQVPTLNVTQVGQVQCTKMYIYEYVWVRLFKFKQICQQFTKPQNRGKKNKNQCVRWF